MAILQAKVPKDLHKGSSELRLMQELGLVTIFTLRVTKVMARALG